jgi:hypothetical protein
MYPIYKQNSRRNCCHMKVVHIFRKLFQHRMGFIFCIWSKKLSIITRYLGAHEDFTVWSMMSNIKKFPFSLIILGVPIRFYSNTANLLKPLRGYQCEPGCPRSRSRGQMSNIKNWLSRDHTAGLRLQGLPTRLVDLFFLNTILVKSSFHYRISRKYIQFRHQGLVISCQLI